MSFGRGRARAQAPTSGSLALSISWGFFWRRLLRTVVFDVVLVFGVTLALVLAYNKTLPEGTLTHGFVPARESVQTYLGWSDPEGLAGFRYVVVTPGRTYTYRLMDDLRQMAPLGIAVLVVEMLGLLDLFGDTRRVRRRLAPLNDLALRAEALGSASLTSFDKIESLEQAIERASVDAPEVKTGDSDLASIEVALNRLLRQMQEAKLQQMRFVNDASHELRTPIAVIQGYVGMLDRWGKTDAAVLEESIEALRSESEHMQELVEQLLFLARGDSGRNALNKVRVNLAGLVSEVWEESSMIDADHRYLLAFDESLADDARLDVVADVAMLKQSMRIVCQNAAKYSAAGSTIRLGAGEGEKGVFFSVTDEGIGMSRDAAGHVFERFYRADNARDAGVEGTGLGLSIAKWIVDSHGGTIDVLSREGVGTRVTVTLPRA